MRFERQIIAGIALTVVGVGLMATSLAGHAAPAQAQQVVTVTVGPGRDGGQTGTATLTAVGSQTQVDINIAPGAAGVGQPAHIHEGSCPGVAGVKYPLTSVVDGKSTTMVPATLAELQSVSLAINVHKSQAEVMMYVACGAIPVAAAPSAGAQPSAGLPRTGGGPASDGSGASTWLLALGGGALLLAGGSLLRLRTPRRRA